MPKTFSMIKSNNPSGFLRLLLFCGAVFCFVLLWLYPQVTHGLFIADTGFHIYQAQQAFQGFGYPGRMIWLTSYLGGAWLSLCPTEGIFFWNALGGAIICSLSYVLAGLIIREIFPLPLIRLFFILAVSAVFRIHFISYSGVHYYTLPFVVAEVAILFYLKYRNSNNEISKTGNLICSAVFFSLLPALRFPTICLIFAPIAYELVLAFYTKRINRKPILIYTAAASITLCCIFLAYLTWRQGFSEFQFILYPDNINTTHSIGHLLYVTAKDIFTSSIIAIPLIAVVWLLRRFSSSPYHWEYLLLLPVIAFTFSPAWEYYVCHSDFTLSSPFKALCNIQRASIIFLLCLILLPSRLGIGIQAKDAERHGYSHGIEFKLSLLMLTGIGFLYPLGSDCFGFKTLYALPILLPILLILLGDYMGLKRSVFRIIIGSMVLIALSVLPGNVDTHAKSTYNRFHMTKPYQVSALSGMYETPEKVAIHEKLIHAIRQYTKPHEEVMFISFLQELLPASEIRSWISTSYFPPHAQDRNIDIYIQNKKLPRVAILVKGEHNAQWDAEWENKLQSLHYQKVYSTGCAMAICSESPNSEFSVWIRNEDS